MYHDHAPVSKKNIVDQRKQSVNFFSPQGKFPFKFFGLCLQKAAPKVLRKPARFFTKGFTAENSGIFYQKQIFVLGGGLNFYTKK